MGVSVGNWAQIGQWVQALARGWGTTWRGIGAQVGQWAQALVWDWGTSRTIRERIQMIVQMGELKFPQKG